MVFEVMATILGITLIAVIGFWQYITTWAQDIFFPWLEKHLPTLVIEVRNAFTWFDKNVSVPILRTIKQAWKKLRQYLLGAVVKFERYSSDRWVRHWTAYLIKKLETREVIVKQQVTIEVDWSELPPDVREAALRRGISDREINVTETRDKEIEEMSYLGV